MVAWWLSRSLCIPESEGTITLYNTQFRGYCRSSLTSELIGKVGTDGIVLWTLDTWKAPVCTLLMNYVGCIITEPHIFSSVSDAPKNSLALILEIIKLTNHVLLLCKIIYLLCQCRNPSIEKHSKS